MRTPRTIGYQAKRAKQSTAPARNAYPVTLSRARRPRRVHVLGAGSETGVADPLPVPGTWTRRGRRVWAGTGAGAVAPVPARGHALARIWFTLPSAVLSRPSTLAPGSVSTADIAPSR